MQQKFKKNNEKENAGEKNWKMRMKEIEKKKDKMLVCHQTWWGRLATLIKTCITRITFHCLSLTV